MDLTSAQFNAFSGAGNLNSLQIRSGNLRAFKALQHDVSAWV